MTQLPSKPLLIDFHKLTVVRGEKAILRNFSLQVRPGEHIVILGPNGSGKSTLIKLMTCELYPQTGIKGSQFRLFGLERWGLEDLRQNLGIVALDMLQKLSHEVTAREVSARDMVLSGFFNSMGLWPHHQVNEVQKRRANEILRFLEISHLSTRPLSAMSSGEQRRALIGRALVHDPQVLLLDEPTTSLDPGAIHEFHVILHKLIRAGKTLVLVTHQVADILPEIDRVIMMKKGAIIADGPKKKILTSAALTRLFGKKLKLIRKKHSYDLVSG
jgi:iron complex transport system ATP-binding protein